MNWRLRSQGHNVYNVEKSSVGEVLVPNPQADHPAPVEPEKPKIVLPEPAPHFPSGPQTIGGKTLQSSGSYADIFPVLFKHVPPRAEGIVVQAGGCVGDDSEKLYTGLFMPMWIFEPSPFCLEKLKRRMHDLVQTHPFPIKVLPFAVGDRCGRVMFRQSYYRDNSGPWLESGTIQKPKLHIQQSPELEWESHQVEVGITRLDSFWENIECPRVHLLFTDVECAEGAMIRGAQKMLRKTKYFFCEASKQERHEGALNLQQTFEMLPGRWTALAFWDHGHFFDMLCVNESLEK